LKWNIFDREVAASLMLLLWVLPRSTLSFFLCTLAKSKWRVGTFLSLLDALWQEGWRLGDEAALFRDPCFFKVGFYTCC